MFRKFFLLTTLFLISVACRAEELLVKNILVKDNQRISTPQITAELKLNTGKINSEQIRAAIIRVYKIPGIKSVIVEETDGNLIFKIEEYPYLRKVFVTGSKAVGSSELEKVLNAKEKKFLDPVFTKRLTEQAKYFYQSKGFNDANVESSYETTDDNQADLTFTISEGPKYKITDVNIEFLEGKFDEDDLIDDLLSKKYKWWKSWITGTGRLNQYFLDTDQRKIEEFMLDHGYVNAKISPAKITKDGENIKILYTVEEGEQFDIGKISFSGKLKDLQKHRNLEKTKLEEGETFNASKIKLASRKLADYYADLGYAFATAIPRTNINIQQKTIDLEFVIEEGTPVHVNRINIIGNNKTADRVVRRELKLHESELFQRKKLERSEARLRRTGYFQDVKITKKDLPDDKSKVDLEVEVTEGPTGSFSLGGGFSSTDGAIFTARLSEANFMGTGRRIRFNVDIGNRRDNLAIGIDDPRFLDTYWRLGLDGFKREREYDDFNRDMQGGGILVGYPMEEIFSEWSQDLDLSIRYQLFDVEIDEVDPNDAAQFVIDSVGELRVSTITPRLVRNTINNPFNPTKGNRQTLQVEYAGLGGDAEYYIAEVRNEMFFPIFDTETDKIVFSWRTKFSYGEAMGDDDRLPLFRRFFPGGINSIRGFQNRRLGPEDENGNEFGGSKQFVNNLELIFPLAPSAGLRGVLFYDIGQAFDDEDKIDFSEMREAVGFGFRWQSPLGPFRVEIGYPLDKQDDEDSVVTLFSFGSPIS